MKPNLSRSVPAPRPSSPARGFTLIEMMITLIVLAVVVLAVSAVIMTASRSKRSSVNLAESTQAARVASDLIARDLRSAGYGADRDYAPRPQRPIAYIDSLQVLINENVRPFPDTSATLRYPLSYNPASTGHPFPLVGTSWTPPIRYRTGAEIVRWTLDVNNDGALNATDFTNADAVDASRTPNPNDWELVRQVYGDSAGGVIGSNGPLTERIALVSRPGGTVPPMFTVYMKGASQPWNWSDGPVPIDSLENIARVLVQVAAESPRPDNRGNYARTVYSTEVHSLRNVPELGSPEYGVDGYVFDDLNKSGTQDAGEPGVAGARVTLGPYATTTAGNGYFLVPAPQGTYTLRHTPPANYGIFTSPDSFVITVPPATSRSFADTARAGGWVTSHAFEDVNANGIQDVGELDMSGIKFTISFMNQTGYTNYMGRVVQFTGVGFYTLSCVQPDSFFVTTVNPVTGSMPLGGTDAYEFGLAKLPFGTLQGKVYRDNNKNGVLDAGETGIAGVWVGASKDGGVNFPGWGYTDNNGNYSFNTPANDPPHTFAYDIVVTPPPGFFPTSGATISNIWLLGSQTLTGNNFGMSSFQVITLTASRVLSLVSGDVKELDYSGAVTNAHKDADIMLGADAAGSDQISTWFNQWNLSPLFNANPTYVRSAPQAVMAMALDSLDAPTTVNTPDLVTGTKNVAAGNFFVWFTQSSSGNEGYVQATYNQAYKTVDLGDVQAVLTYDCAGGLGTDRVDIIVGTKSPTANYGSVEVWKSSNASTPTFTREDVYPPSGTLAGGGMGEVTSMALADIDADGKKDLIVGTRTGTYSGQVLFFKFVAKNAAPHFAYMSKVDLSSDQVNALVVVDVNNNGTPDVVVGTQDGVASGNLIYLHNQTPAIFDFNIRKVIAAPGIVTAISVGDFGGLASQDIVMGYRQSTSSYAGGVRVFYLDSRTLPATGTDPSNGALINWVPATTVNNFNFGANPAAVSPFLTDFAAGVKSGITTGALVLFIR